MNTKVSPAVLVGDLAESIAWYQDAFEGTVKYRNPRTAEFQTAWFTLLLQEHDEFKHGFFYDLREERIFDVVVSMSPSEMAALADAIDDRVPTSRVSEADSDDQHGFTVLDCNNYAIRFESAGDDICE